MAQLKYKTKKARLKTNVKEDKTIRAAPTSNNLFLDTERLKDICENIPSAIVVVEKPDGRVIYANKRAMELYGTNPLGIRLENFAKDLKIYKLDGEICPTDRLKLFRALFLEETIRNETIIIGHPEAKHFIVNVSAKPLYDKEGNATAAVAIFDDVTEQVKTYAALQESENRFKMAQRIAHLGNWEYNIKEDKAIWSDELFRIFGLKKRKFGPNSSEYLSHIFRDDKQKLEKSIQEMTNQGLNHKTAFEYRIIRADGTTRTIYSQRLVKEIDEDGTPKRIVGIEQDITERKLIEQKLEETAKNLESLVAERTKQLKDAERLAAIGQTAGMIGHDIRNPLQAVTGELFLIKQDVDSSPDSQCKRAVKESLDSIQEQVDYINKIVSDLQDYARPLKPELQSLDVCNVIPRLLSTVPVPSNIQAFIDCGSGLPIIELDLTFLKRILVNLVTNAIQAMPNGGKLNIKAFKEDKHVSITVQDTGQGIPDELKPKLFQPLMTTKSKGQGFGLAVVKRLVEAQGGTITLESQVGKGTKFKITFPIKS